ncbi:putative molybdenum carrier protein [Desulfobulbus sp.]|uniref:putative molybdenum carrier protein n=1 Tax=Desulfobulbus sp. TaxID=895 RepID=UPI00286F668D|nr:putative molybdenum carrier protein [Desulfobulbus sp.]
MMIISGGQTGADRAALDAAIALALPHGGWLPRGRKTEAGPLPARYRLKELDSHRYRDRTEKNVLTADGTLICSFGPLTGGSALTEALAIRHDRPLLHIDFELVDKDRARTLVEEWVRRHELGVVNVAGPRASSEPRIYQAVHALLLAIRWPADRKSPIGDDNGRGYREAPG